MLEVRHYDRSKDFVTLTACPCGYEFAEEERRWKHFLEDHDPGDFEGIGALGERLPSSSGALHVPLDPDEKLENHTHIDCTADSGETSAADVTAEASD